MSPKQSRSFSRSLSRSSFPSSSSSGSKGKRKQNKLDFSFHSISHASKPTTLPSGSRPLSSTPSFGIPSVDPSTAQLPSAVAEKGKQKQSHSSTIKPKASEHDNQDESCLWAEKLAPRSSDQLAVHPKKVAQVRSWLAEAFSSRAATVKYRKVLTLTGPAGAGKSSTVRALATAPDLDFDILEWQNDHPAFDPSNPAPSFIERFVDFLSKAAKFPTLDLKPPSNGRNSSASSSLLPLDEMPSSAKRNRLILLEDLPNLHHLSTKQLFQAAIEQYIRQSTHLTSRGSANVPILLIVTESTPREDEDRWVADASSSNWQQRIASIIDTRSALGEAIRNDPAYAEVTFNPVAPTIIIKALKRAIEQAPPGSGRVLEKGMLMELLQAVAEDSNGDLRAAVNCLQFVGINRGLLHAAAGAKGRKTGNKGATQQERSNIMRKLIPLVSGRESSLALFHALGRVLYNKREGDPNDQGPQIKRAINQDAYSDSEDDDANNSSEAGNSLQRDIKTTIRSFIPPSTSHDTGERLPEHMSHLFRRQSRVSVDQLWADLPVDSCVFQLYLHANFPQFCDEAEECESILEAFSAADALMPRHEQYLHSSVVAYYSFLVSVRATLLALPSPVKRRAQKLGKSAWWDVQKKLRGMMGDVQDVKSAYTPGLKSFSGAGGDGEASSLKRVKFNNPSFASDADADAGSVDASASIGPASLITRSNTITLVTEILPALAKIQLRAGTDDKMHELARMQFEYPGVADIASRQLDQHETGLLDNEDDEEAHPTMLTEEKTGKRKAVQLQKQHKIAAVDEQEDKLILSDDDIADF
ncbi:hypothetical protein NDA18_003474 [Ustilago nuda]|nr:hypothetical protein NDA18_003474 [Ustilago nuda]